MKWYKKHILASNMLTAPNIIKKQVSYISKSSENLARLSINLRMAACVTQIRNTGVI